MIEVSVIIPAHNRATYLARTFDSVLAQRGVSLEVLVVDDGSTDDTPEAVAPYLNRLECPVRLLQQERRGPAGARNLGLRHAIGEYVAFIDSDDLWLPGHLQRAAAVLDDEPEVGLVCSAIRQIDEHDRPLPDARRHLKGESGWVFDKLLLRCFVNSPTVVLRRAVLDRTGLFDPDIWPLEDWDLWLRVARHAQLRFLPEPSALYRIHVGQATHAGRQSATRREQMTLKVLGKAFDLGADETLRRRALTSAYTRLAYWYLLEHDPVSTRRCLREARGLRDATVPDAVQAVLWGLSWLPRRLRDGLAIESIHRRW
ncbi:MAG: glycosyltransferase family A protein [Chromatiales bacterium]|nr:glycosyltransferase family A protein [Chromatiales bacterium]